MRTTCRDSDWNECPRHSVISSRGLRQRHRLQETVVWRSRMPFCSCLTMRFRPTVRPRRPSAAKQLRMSTSATLLALAVCAILAKGHLLEARTPSHNAAVAQNAGTAPVTIVAPEFCKDQTWPYINSRCLRRVDNPPADARQAIAPPATTAAATPAPDGMSAKAVAAPPANSEAAASTSTPPAAPAPSSPDTRAQDTGRKSSNRYFQRLNRPQRAITMFSVATPPPQLMRLPTSAPATIHSIVGRGIGTTIPAFSDFASS